MKTVKVGSIVIGLALGAGLFVGAVNYQATLSTAMAAPAKIAKKAAKQVVYICPMHPEVVAAKPGKCPKCKMTLTRKTVSAVYTCPMHPKVLSLKPGKCPICKMTLKKK